MKTALASMVTGTSTTWNFASSAYASLGTISSTTTVGGLTLGATQEKNMQVIRSPYTLSGTTYEYCLALMGGGNTGYRFVKFNVTGPCQIVVVGRSSGTDSRKLRIANASGTVLSSMTESSSITMQTYKYTGSAGSIYLYSANSGINIYQIQTKY